MFCAACLPGFTRVRQRDGILARFRCARQPFLKIFFAADFAFLLALSWSACLPGLTEGLPGPALPRRYAAENLAQSRMFDAAYFALSASRRAYDYSMAFLGCASALLRALHWGWSIAPAFGSMCPSDRRAGLQHFKPGAAGIIAAQDIGTGGTQA